MQHKGKTGEFYVIRASKEVSSHPKKSHKEIFGKTTTRPGGELELKSIMEVKEKRHEGGPDTRRAQGQLRYIGITSDGVKRKETTS
jgi:hypothetical protein